MWNYGLKGGLGSLLLVTVFPLLCIAVCATCVTAAVTAPLWMPLVTLAVHLFFILIYDFDHPSEGLCVCVCVCASASAHRRQRVCSSSHLFIKLDCKVNVSVASMSTVCFVGDQDEFIRHSL